MTAELAALFDDKRLVVCVGPGGVGKTTVSAAIGRQAAARGRSVAVVTIDPARRLADAMGLTGLGNELATVFRGADGGRLDAAMIDTQSSYDALLHRLTSEGEGGEIFQNAVYRAFSRTLSRSHAYVAMERLHEIMARGEHDLIVLDTPPLRSALDILDAPGRLVRFLDDGVVSWFVEPPRRGPLSRLVPAGGAAARRLLALLASQRLVRETAGFFGTLAGFRKGFSERATQTQDALRSASTAFVIVTAPTPTSLEDARYLTLGLAERRVPRSLVIFNRAFTGNPRAESEPLSDWNGGALRAAAGPALAALAASQRDALLDAMERVHRHAIEKNQRQQALVAGFLAECGADVAWGALPELDDDVHDVEGLLALAATFRLRSASQ